MALAYSVRDQLLERWVAQSRLRRARRKDRLLPVAESLCRVIPAYVVGDAL